MSNVTLDVGGRRYTVACAPGEESHIEALGALINARLAETPGLAGQTEVRTLLYAALLLADEVAEGQKATKGHQTAPNMAEPLENLAERLELLAARLEGSAAAS
ncbi:cell division protein ZapA [Alteraurantiacibacter palmitatis]|uniref:Cell division protein ZapA n=1 Tax=Alteraurantiacibacter palmitatis TaxID=2054628 RepID=A0ABV7E4L4_9SPHN